MRLIYTYYVDKLTILSTTNSHIMLLGSTYPTSSTLTLHLGPPSSVFLIPGGEKNVLQIEEAVHLLYLV